VTVDMAIREDALRWNKKAVTNLNYEMAPCGESVPTGITLSFKQVWIVPGTFPNFAIELRRWAIDCYFKNPSL